MRLVGRRHARAHTRSHLLSCSLTVVAEECWLFLALEPMVVGAEAELGVRDNGSSGPGDGPEPLGQEEA